MHWGELEITNSLIISPLSTHPMEKKSKSPRILLVLILAATAISCTNGANILFLVPSPSPSHWLLLQHFIKELVNRGHIVTAVACRSIDNLSSPNYTKILIDPPLDMDKYCEFSSIFFTTEKLKKGCTNLLSWEK